MSMPLGRNTEAMSDGPNMPLWVTGISAPKHPICEVETLVKRYFGIDGRLVPLDGERDQNFLVSASGAQRHVLKISSGSEPRANVDYQVALLSHLEGAASHLPLPRTVASKHGEPYILHQFENGQSNTVRLITYLDGQPLSEPQHLRDGWAGHLGAFQGMLCCALQGFDHVGATRFMPWNSSSRQMFDRDVLAYLEPDFTSLIEPHLARLRQTSLPALHDMRSQVIHNDIHPGNVLLDDRRQISGVIDFGDAIRAPVIQDLAVSATSLIEFSTSGHLSLISDLIEGFCSKCPLASDELALLHDAILLRSILSVALGRMKDQFVPPARRPRPASKASAVGLHSILSLEEGALSSPGGTHRFAHG